MIDVEKLQSKVPLEALRSANSSDNRDGRGVYLDKFPAEITELLVS